jgi:hypothetical protein
MAAPGTAQHMKGDKGKGKERKAVPAPIHGHKHGKVTLGHSHGNGLERHHASK